MPPRKARPRARKPPAVRPPPSRAPRPAGPLIAGLGASAGGLAALEKFFANAPSGLGVAYVVVQHLDPEHASILGELLQRVSRLPVVEVTDGMKVAADVVHVIPPNREMEVFDGTLLLTVPSAPRGQRMAVDGFFRSLADEQGSDAIGLVLSGTGTDGALGLRAIHDAGGLCFVQEPATAKFDGMPLAALRAVDSSTVAPVEKLPALLAGALATVKATTRLPAPSRAVAAGLGRVLTILRSATGRDFSLYKRSSVVRRVERRMAANAIDDIEVYARHLREHPAEVKTLFQELLINVTSFFRDPEAFAALRDEVLAKLVESKAGEDGEVIRVWVAGCATGEEAYSIAILLRELMEKAGREVKVQIYGTDLDEHAVSAARAGVYPVAIEADVTPERLRRFFVREEAGYRVRREIREQVVFAVQDLIKDPPFTRLDLISCRNVFIYMETALQDRILTLFHYALRPGGVLFLSPAEGIGDHARRFSAIDRKWRLFRAQRDASSTRAVLFGGPSWVKGPHGSEDMKKTPPSDYAEITRRVLLQTSAPASVLTDRDGTILYVHGETGQYLRPAPGQPTLSVADMALDGLQVEIRGALRRAATSGKPVHRPGIPVTRNGATQTVDLTVRPVGAPKGAQGLLLLSFHEAKASAPSKGARGKRGARAADASRIQELTRALAYTRESLQATIEEQQTAHEELQSSNEELQSTNEEVQASNEELETAKEELQSVNEELTTVNAELQGKVEQLTGMQDDMKNLLDAISVGTVFLDEPRVTFTFTREACRIYRLAPGDVGRPLVDIKSNLVEHDLVAEAQAVLDDLVPVEREVRCADGAWYLARLLPYRTVDNAIRGVVMTFTDISKRVQAEAIAQAERELAARIVDTVRDPLLVLDGSLRVVSASRSFHDAFGTTALTSTGRHVYELAERRWDIPALRELLERVLPRDQSFERFEVNSVEADGTPGRMYLDGRRIGGHAGSAELILLVFKR